MSNILKRRGKEKRKNFFKSYLLPPHNQSATENIIHAILGTGYYTEKKQR